MRPPLTHAGRAAARQYAAPLALACTVGPGRPEGRDRPRTWSVIDRQVVTQAGSAAFRLLPRTLRPPPKWRRPPRTIATRYRAAAEQPKPGFVGGASGGPACAAAAVQPPAPRPAGPPGAMRAGVPRPSAVCGAGRPPCGGRPFCATAAQRPALARGPLGLGRAPPGARAARPPPRAFARRRLGPRGRGPCRRFRRPPGWPPLAASLRASAFGGPGFPAPGRCWPWAGPPPGFPPRPPLRGASALQWRAVARRDVDRR